MERAGDPQFEGGFRICRVTGKGRRWPRRRVWKIADNGWAEINEGRLTLHWSGGRTITEGPVSEVRAKPTSHGASAWISIGEERYFLMWLKAEPSMVYALPFGGARRDNDALKLGKEIMKQFLATVEANGGRVQKP